MSTKKPTKLEISIWDALMAQDHYYGMAPIDCWGVTMTDAWRDPGVVEQLIEQGRFGEKLGRMLRELIHDPHAPQFADYELRTLTSDGHGYALFVAVKGGILMLALLVFQRGPKPFSNEEKVKMYKALDIAADLRRCHLEEQIQIAKQEAAAEAAKQEGAK